MQLMLANVVTLHSTSLQENICKTPRDVLRDGYEYLDCDIEAPALVLRKDIQGAKSLQETTICSNISIKTIWVGRGFMMTAHSRFAVGLLGRRTCRTLPWPI